MKKAIILFVPVLILFLGTTDLSSCQDELNIWKDFVKTLMNDEMNLERILSRYPKEMDLRRIDLTIGEKEFWDQGWGTRMIALLTQFGFQKCNADAIFGCDVGDYNPRSRRAFEKNGYVIDRVIPQRLPASTCRNASQEPLASTPRARG